MMTATTGTPSAFHFNTEVCIVGAGPVGSFLALRLASAGIRVHIFEQRTKPPERSMAIGIMPPTLLRMAPLGLDDGLVRAGIQVRRAIVHDDRQILGALNFSSLPMPHNFILTLPQGALVSTLWQRLANEPLITFSTDCPVEAFSLGAEGVSVQTAKPSPIIRPLRCRYLVLCDGTHSRFRSQLGAETLPHRYGLRFVMGDAPDATGWGNVAHLFFTPSGSLESFPLPGNRRRWVALVGTHDPEMPDAVLDERIRRLTGGEGRSGPWSETSAFAPERRMAPRYVYKRVILCGDAAHVMSPIGGQGMNIGLGDADAVAETLTAILRKNAVPTSELGRFERQRQRVFRQAAARAERGMWLGTRTGRLASALRSALIRILLQMPAGQPWLARYFSMWSLPDAAPLLRSVPTRRREATA